MSSVPASPTIAPLLTMAVVLRPSWPSPRARMVWPAALVSVLPLLPSSPMRLMVLLTPPAPMTISPLPLRVRLLLTRNSVGLLVPARVIVPSLATSPKSSRSKLFWSVRSPSAVTVSASMEAVPLSSVGLGEPMMAESPTPFRHAGNVPVAIRKPEVVAGGVVPGESLGLRRRRVGRDEREGQGGREHGTGAQGAAAGHNSLHVRILQYDPEGSASRHGPPDAARCQSPAPGFNLPSSLPKSIP